MKKNIWKSCHGSQHIMSLQCHAWRVVEAQHINSTRKLVDTLEEQELLEEMIESVKPPVLKDTTETYHYLLFTPFRYPPLEYGSRFGTKYEPSLWYGSLSVRTALVESAYYRLVFLDGTEADLDYITSWISTFQASIATKCGIDLTKEPFNFYRDKISSPTEYNIAQQLGAAMRDDGIESFFYFSSRDREVGINVGLFAETAFKDTSVDLKSITNWQCFVTSDSVEYLHNGMRDGESYEFTAEDFCIDGVLPTPAC